MMRFTLIISIFSFAIAAFGQKIPHKVSCFKISKINHNVPQWYESKNLKKITNRANLPYEVLYLDSSSTLLEKRGYGKQHDLNLRLLDYVEQYKYKDGKLDNSVKYFTDYNNQLTAYYKSYYFYNDQNILVRERNVHFGTDSPLLQFTYEYDENGNNYKTFFNADVYELRTYDQEMRVVTYSQIYKDRLRWQWTYTYIDSSIIGNFKTFYQERNHTRVESKKYRNGMVMEIEKYYSFAKGYPSKILYDYDGLGLIRRIDFLERSSSDTSYRLMRFIEIKSKIKCALSPLSIQIINSFINEE